MSDVENTEIPLSQAWRENSLAILALGLCFLVSHMLAMYLVPFVLWIARKGLEWVLQAIFMSAIGVTFIYVFYPFFHSVGITGFAGYIGATALAIELTFLLLTYPEWYVVDIAGVILAAGVAAIFGISFGLFPALLLLVGLAIYDAWAVYRTGHMVDLADSVMNLKLPILLVMPKSKGYSFLDQGSLADQIEKGEKREALFMGLGDLVIPGALVVSSKASLGWMVGISSMVGGLVGFCILMVFVLSGRPQAGLPLLNGGAILGYVVGAFIFVGNLGL